MRIWADPAAAAASGEANALNKSDHWLGVAVLAYAASSLFHHIHNAEFLAEYSGMPSWLSRAWVYFAWVCVTTVGLGGIVSLWKQRRLLGLCLLGAYGALGLSGLAHYVVAPATALTVGANLSISLEVVTAVLLLGVVATCIYRERSHDRGRDLA